MANDFEGRIWSEHHSELSDGLGALFDKLAYAFRRLQAIEYDAPWEREAARIRGTLPKRHKPAEPTLGRGAAFR